MPIDFQPDDDTHGIDFQADEHVGGGKQRIQAALKQMSDEGQQRVQEGMEAVRFGLGGAVAPFLAPVPAALSTLNDHTNFLENYEKYSNELVPQPKTERGQEAAQNIGEFANYWLNPLLGHIGDFHLAPMEKTPAIDFKEDVQKPKRGLDDNAAVNDAAAQTQTQQQAQAQPLIDPTDPFAQMKSQLDVPQTNEGPFIEPDVLAERQQPMNAFDQMRQNLEQQDVGAQQSRYADVQRELEDRQTQLEQNVKQQGTLDYNAAERARQEQARLPDEQQQPNRNDAYIQQLLEEADRKYGENVSGTPAFFKDPDASFPNPEGPSRLRVPKSQRGALAIQDIVDGIKRLAQGTRIETHDGRIGTVVSDRFVSQIDPDKLYQRMREENEKIQSRYGPEYGWSSSAKAAWDQAYQRVKLELTNEKIGHFIPRVDFGEGRAESVFPSEIKKAYTGLKSQRGAVNPEVFQEGFQKLKQLADGTWLRAFGDGQALTVEARKDGHIIGSTTFDPKYPDRATDNRNLEAFSTGVNPSAQGKGIATEMYKFASELGNDIQPSDVQTNAGKAMWQGFEKNGLAENGIIKSPGNKQRGALLIDPKDEGKAKFLSNHPSLKLKTIVPDKWTPEQAIDAAKATTDVSQNWFQRASNYFTKGGEYQALKTDHPVVKYAFQQMMEGDRVGRGLIQQYVHDGIAKVSRAMNDKEAAEIVKAINRADFNKVELTEDILRRNGANDKQIAYWKTHREVMDRVFDGINNVLKSLGKEPIDKRTAYAAMRSTGDYRRLVYKVGEDGEKHVVGIVGSDFRKQLNNRVAALKELHPEYEIGEEKYFGGVPRDKGNASAAMMHTLEVLSKNDPHVKEFLDTYDNLVTNEAYNFLNMKRHTMDKKGVFGMEGRKDWLTDEQNAKEFMQAQINYAESGLKWEQMSKAAQNVYKVLGDNTVASKSPNAVAWADYYVKNALGFNPDKAGHAIEQAFADMARRSGVGYSVYRQGISVARKVINMTLLGLNPPFLLTNLVQPMMAMPGVKAYLASKGLNLSFDMGTGLSYFTRAAMTEWKHYADKDGGNYMSPVEKGAYDYAKSHHVYGSDLIEHSNRARPDTLYYMDKIGGMGSQAVESGTRRAIYLAFTHMLDDNGLSKADGLYEAAHNLTDMAMNNYSTLERPRIYNTFGPLGQMAVNLSSYKHNELSRLSLFVRQIGENEGLLNKTRPLLAYLGSSIAFAGLLGTIGWDNADFLIGQISKLLGKPFSLTQQAINLSESASKQFPHVLSHGMFSLADVDMSKRLGVQQLFGQDAMDMGFPGASRLVDSAKAIGQAAINPSEMNAKRAAYNLPFMPQPARTNMELEWFSKNGGRLGNSVNNDKATVVRNDADIAAKRLGFTGINESVQKDKLYQVKTINKMYSDLRQHALDNIRDDLFAKGQPSPANVQKYLSYQGDSNTLMSDINRYAQEQNVPAYERELLRTATAKSITSLQEAQRLTNAFKR